MRKTRGRVKSRSRRCKRKSRVRMRGGGGQIIIPHIPSSKLPDSDGMSKDGKVIDVVTQNGTEIMFTFYVRKMAEGDITRFIVASFSGSGNVIGDPRRKLSNYLIEKGLCEEAIIEPTILKRIQIGYGKEVELKQAKIKAIQESKKKLADEEDFNQRMRDGRIDSYMFYGNKPEN